MIVRLFLFCCSVQTVEGIRLFTTSGYKYYRMFQVSLCASGDADAKFPLATCSSNASLDLQVINQSFCGPPKILKIFIDDLFSLGASKIYYRAEDFTNDCL